MPMIVDRNLKQLFLLLTTCFSAQAAHAQSGIVAGQTGAMQIVRPSNLYFACDSQPPHSCSQVDIDGDGSYDFRLYFEGSGAYNISLRSLLPNTWQLLGDAFLAGLMTAVPRGGLINAISGNWLAAGILQYETGYNGVSTRTGFWGNDTLTRYIGIRQLKNNQWHYGYVITKKMAANSYSAPLYVTVTALQQVATATVKPQLAGIEVYPNPVQSTLQVRSPHEARLRIYDATGRLQHDELLRAGTSPISVAKWALGIYLMRLENEQGVFIFRFQKNS